MKTKIVVLFALLAFAPLAEAAPKYQVLRANGSPAPWWFHFGLPIVPREKCKVRPELMREDKLRGYGPFHQDAANNAGRF